MITSIMNCINNDLEKIALQIHKPQNALYVVVKRDGSYKTMSTAKFSFNSKYSLWDFFSLLISINKPIDKTKTIQSNNKYSFFIKDFSKLKSEKIDLYYEICGLKEDEKWIKEWIYTNINKFSSEKKKVKIFFEVETDRYIEEGRNYYLDKSISDTRIINNELLGTSVFLNTNPKKPYLLNRTRNSPISHLVNKKEGYQIYMLYRIFNSLYDHKKSIIYFTPDGKIMPFGIKDEVKGVPAGSIFTVIRKDSRGKIVIVKSESISMDITGKLLRLE